MFVGDVEFGVLIGGDVVEVIVFFEEFLVGLVLFVVVGDVVGVECVDGDGLGGVDGGDIEENCFVIFGVELFGLGFVVVVGVEDNVVVVDGLVVV